MDASTPWASATLVFGLLRGFTDGTGEVATFTLLATTNSAGDFSAALRVPDDGSTAFYGITLPDGSSLSTALSLGDGSPILLSVLLGGTGGTISPLPRRSI